MLSSDQLKNVPARNHGMVGLRRREKHAHNLAVVGKGSPATGTNLDVAQKPSGRTSARAPDCRSRTQSRRLHDKSVALYLAFVPEELQANVKVAMCHFASFVRSRPRESLCHPGCKRKIKIPRWSLSVVEC